MLTLDSPPMMVGAETSFGTAGGCEVAERSPLMPATVMAALASPGPCSGVVWGLVRKSGEERTGWVVELRPEVASPGASGGVDVERPPRRRFSSHDTTCGARTEESHFKGSKVDGKLTIDGSFGWRRDFRQWRPLELRWRWKMALGCRLWQL